MIQGDSRFMVNRYLLSCYKTTGVTLSSNDLKMQTSQNIGKMVALFAAIPLLYLF